MLKILDFSDTFISNFLDTDVVLSSRWQSERIGQY